MVYHQFEAPRRVCTGRLFWVWGVYAMAMCWLWNGLTGAGFPAVAVWALAGFTGVALLLATREL